MAKEEGGISIGEVIQRINRKLAARGQVVMSTRKMKMTQYFGDCYILDVSGKVIEMDVDPEELARKLGVLKEGEKVKRRKLRPTTSPER